MVEGERAEGEVVGCGCGGGEHDGGSGDQGGAAGRQKRSHGGSFTACGRAAVGPAPAAEDCRVTGLGRGHATAGGPRGCAARRAVGSEERRVGGGWGSVCRCGWSAYHSK